MVLAAQAAKVTAWSPDRKGHGPGLKVVEGFFFNRVQGQGPGISIIERIQEAVLVNA
jgi:hypothetical protein